MKQNECLKDMGRCFSSETGLSERVEKITKKACGSKTIHCLNSLNSPERRAIAAEFFSQETVTILLHSFILFER